MSVSLGAENHFILNVFTYYDRLYQWKRKLKRNVKARLFRKESLKANNNQWETSNIFYNRRGSSDNKPENNIAERHRKLKVLPDRARPLSRVSTFRRKVLMQAGNYFNFFFWCESKIFRVLVRESNTRNNNDAS